MPTEKRQRKRAGQAARRAAEEAARRRAGRRRQFITLAVVVAVGAGLVVLLSSGGGKKHKKVAATTSTTAKPGSPVKLSPVPSGASLASDTPCPAADGSSARTSHFAKAPPTCIDPSKTYTAALVTSKGPITIALDAKAAPATVNNFVVLARYHFYDGIAFHRIVPDFVDQVGDPQETGTGGPGYQFPDELPKNGYKPGSVAMANSGPNTNGSQFFLVASDSGARQLQNLYSLFGQVTQGMEVVTAINGKGLSSGQPTEVVTIKSVTITES